MALDPNIGSAAPLVSPDMLARVKAAQALQGGMAAMQPPSAPAGPVLASPVPLTMPSLPSPNVAPSQTLGDQAHLAMLKQTGSGIDQIKNPLLRGVARGADIAAQIAGSVFSPLGVAEHLIPGTQGHHNMLVGQAAGRVAQDQQQDLAKTQQEDAQAQTEMRQAQAQRELAKANALDDPSKAIDASKTVTTDDGVFQLNPATGRYDVRVGDRVEKPKSIEEQAFDAALTQNGGDKVKAYASVYGAKNQKDANLPQQYLDAVSSGDTTKAALIRKVINDTQVQPKIEVHAAEARPESTGTWQMAMGGDGKPVFFNSKTGEVRDNPQGITKVGGKGAKPNADEQKRADFAQNMGENINVIEDVLNRRPELFGPMAGTLTSLKSHLGSNDVDIAKLEAASHQLAMVTQGVHGMRSSQGLEGAARSLLNGYHNSPAATRAALETARASTKTFLSDADHPGASRSPQASGKGGSNDPLGIR